MRIPDKGVLSNAQLTQAYRELQQDQRDAGMRPGPGVRQGQRIETEAAGRTTPLEDAPYKGTRLGAVLDELIQTSLRNQDKLLELSGKVARLEAEINAYRTHREQQQELRAEPQRRDGKGKAAGKGR